MIGAPQSLKTVLFFPLYADEFAKVHLVFLKAVMQNVVVRKFTAGVFRTLGTHASTASF